MEPATLGILGVGHLASYTVKGLRHSGDTRTIILSPRGARVAKKLADICNCEIATDNQAVIDQSDLVLLAVRPDALSDLINGLTFKPSQTVISALAGVTIEQLRSHPELRQCELVRVMPSTSAEVCSGPIPLYPANPVVEALFVQLGTAVPLESEELFDVALSHACLHGWSYFLIQQLIDWSCAQGMDEATARKMVAHSISSAVDFAEAKPEQRYGEIGRSIATEGTFTLQGIEAIKANGGLDSWQSAMELIAQKAKG
ncbi:NAD(P)-binding domain-containing protein [Pontibacterium granulatum]|uniref:NAD(P)-binding domain-containing protein n=1 Tax=Pontibacterium granulatum TaxID=2036029 RepID=UPI00249B8695|nr:NAD(P)-binding domain-containing protein [Pontibacterium granulatum]MDI3325772.1 NAD(P)-binding domain-containing protein [Pontibacterium granulatum]